MPLQSVPRNLGGQSSVTVALEHRWLRFALPGVRESRLFGQALRHPKFFLALGSELPALFSVQSPCGRLF